MIFSMTGYATASRELMSAVPAVPVTPVAPSPSSLSSETISAGMLLSTPAPGMTTVSVDIRTVNSRFLDLHFRMPDEVRACEPGLRELLMSKLSRGKVEVRVNVQRADTVSSGTLNPDALTHLAALQHAAVAAFPTAGTLRVADILRWPGVMADHGMDEQALRDAVHACACTALKDLIDVRQREGDALGAMLHARVIEMEHIVAEITPLIPELIVRHQDKIVERLQQALGIALRPTDPASGSSGAPLPSIGRDEVLDRIRQEVTVYGIRIDIAEELMRLTTHLAETRHVLEKGGKVGKRLDFMMQELNREANTVGSKAAAKELADAAMALKLLIEQMREQVQNLE